MPQNIQSQADTLYNFNAESNDSDSEIESESSENPAKHKFIVKCDKIQSGTRPGQDVVRIKLNPLYSEEQGPIKVLFHSFALNVKRKENMFMQKLKNFLLNHIH